MSALVTIRDLSVETGRNYRTLIKWVQRLHPEAKIGPVYALPRSKLARFLATIDAAPQGWPKGKKRGPRSKTALSA